MRNMRAKFQKARREILQEQEEQQRDIAEIRELFEMAIHVNPEIAEILEGCDNEEAVKEMAVSYYHFQRMLLGDTYKPIDITKYALEEAKRIAEELIHKATIGELIER